jgi:sugar phosphate isomerase/epimerase
MPFEGTSPERFAADAARGFSFVRREPEVEENFVLRRGMSRRELIRAAGAAAVVALVHQPTGAASQDAADKSLLDKRQPAGLKLSCSSLAFSDVKWDEALEAIQKLGFHYAELAMFEGWAHTSPSTLADPEGLAKKIAFACGKFEIEPVAIRANFALGDHTRFPGLTISDPAARKTLLAHFERVVICARAAAIPLISVLPGKFIEGVPREMCFKNAAELLTTMLAMAARRGLALSFDPGGPGNSGSIAQQPDDALRLLAEVPGLRLDYDLSHIVASAISVEQTVPLLKHVAHVGVRNAKPNEQNLPLNGEQLDYEIQPFLRTFRDANVNAYVSVDYFQTEMRDSIPRLKAILEREGVSVR